MHQFSRFIAALFLSTASVATQAQSSSWDGLARTTFDIAASTLRIPCVALEDGSGMPIPGSAPAYALNLEVVGEALRLVEPIQAFAEVPASCLDTLVVDGNLATYSTTSAETDSTDVSNTNRFFTIELQANLGASGPIDFAVESVEDRIYSRPFFDGENFVFLAGPAPYPSDFVYDNSLVEEALRLTHLGLTVLEAGRLEVSCDYNDPESLLETVSSGANGTEYRIKPSLSSSDNGKIFSITCTAFNHDINRLELTIPFIEWIISLP